MKRTSLQNILDSLGGERRIHYALDRFQAALVAVGSPEKSVYSVIISGTNGKGTTSLFVSSALLHSGFRVVTYLSPHLQSPTERFLFNLNPIEEPELTELASEFEPVAQKFELSYFEYLTLLNFIWAQRKKTDFLVLEVGLGGRLDATNVTNPLASAITNIAWDHQDYLGNSLESILNEKLGILRPESLLFTGVTDPNLLQVIEARCNELDAIYYYSKDLPRKTLSQSWVGQEVSICGFPFHLSNPSPGTLENAVLSLHLLRIVFPKIPVVLIQEAFRSVITPGRFEIVSEKPRVILSGDHNPAGIECLRETIGKLKPERLKILCAFSPDKPYRDMYESLKTISDSITLTQISRYRGKMPEDYAKLGPFAEHPAIASEHVLSEAEPEDTVLITGSLYLVGELRTQWHSRGDFLKK